VTESFRVCFHVSDNFACGSGLRGPPLRLGTHSRYMRAVRGLA